MALPLAQMDKILKKAGAERVSKSAREELAKILEKHGENVAKDAIRRARHSGRKTVTGKDFESLE